ncbi:MAG: glycosyltransferase family 2 protein [Bacteroidia bacterium]
MKKLSILITVLNEEDNIKPLLEEIHQALQGFDYEIVIVDDGSTDRTRPNIRREANHRVKLVELTKNYGQSTAMAAGIDAAEGEFLVTMDGDLQNDPHDIPAMLKKLEDGEWDLVAGYRKNRQDKMLSRKLPSRLANSLIRWLTGVKITDYGCTLKVYRVDIARGLGLYGELHRFIPALAFMQGARITEVPVNHRSRKYGQSKYRLSRTFKVISDLILIVFFQKYLVRPMHLFGVAGFIILVVGIFINLYLAALKIAGQDIWGKPLLILGLLLTLGGFQLITTGIITELLMRTYYESQNKKTYKIRNTFVGKEKKAGVE